MPAPIKNALARLQTWLAHYFFGLFAFSFNNATVALDGVIGLAVGAAITPDLQAPSWKTAVAIFGTCFARSAVTYFAKNPLPTKLTDDEGSQPIT